MHHNLKPHYILLRSQIYPDSLWSLVHAADLFGKNLADFLATQVDAMDKEGNYNFTNAKYGFDPYVLNQGGCNNGAQDLYPHGAVITPTQAILDGESSKHEQSEVGIKRVVLFYSYLH